MHISLHNRSAFSFGSALTMPEQLAEFAAANGMSAIALTDLDGLYAAVPFQQACAKAGVKPIFGVELVASMSLAGTKVSSPGRKPWVSDRAVITSPGGAKESSPRDGRSFAPPGLDASGASFPGAYAPGYSPSPLTGLGVPEGRLNPNPKSQISNLKSSSVSLTLLAQTLSGYANLCRLISLQHLRDDGIGLADVRAHAADVICLVGRIFESPTPVGVGHALTALRDAFAGRLYVELALHAPEDAPLARRRAQVADELGVPVVAVCESRCLRREQMTTLRALASIGTLTLLDQPHPDKPVGDWHLRTSAEMEHLFRRRPDALANTRVIAEQCNVVLNMESNRFPAFDSPDGRSAMQHLRELGVAGCRRRYVEEPPLRGIGGKRPTLDEALQRLDRELGIIEQVHYAEYFLVFHEIVEYCRSQGIATLARGSAADSLLCYALGVSHACPFRFDLPFDRFVNPERAKFSKMADIDLDLPWDQRDQVIRWVYDRWGHDRVAMIGSPNTFHGRAAVAELGKVFGLPASEVHRVTKLLPRVAAWNLAESIAASPETRDLPIDQEPYRTILRMAGALEGLPRHWAMHPCGLVVAPEPLTDLVPVQRSPKGPLVAQYEMDAIEELGFIKIDLLGQAGLSVLRDAVGEINRTGAMPKRSAATRGHVEPPTCPRPPSACLGMAPAPKVDLTRDVDYADAATWDMIATGQARGIHHIESPAMTSLIKECDCRDIDCLTSVVAIIRPGAANQGKKEAFARRHQGFEPPAYAHPALVSVLEQTYGLMVFEEHILQVAVEFAGMNLGRADVLRRALNRENRAMIRELKDEFCACARAKGRAESEIAAVWPVVEGFAGFMFNKAHSAEYAVEAFQGAWLKRRWPAHYIAAILSNYRGFYANSPTLPQILYVMEALRHGAGFLPPCVNRSRERFSVEYGSPEGTQENSPGRKPWVDHRALAPSPGGAEERLRRQDDSAAPPGLELMRGFIPGAYAPGYTLPPLRGLTRRRTMGHPMIRVPVAHINGLSQGFIERYRAERERGEFTSLDDFINRCRPGEAASQLLLDCGALDVFSDSRPALFWELRGRIRREKGSGPWAAMFEGLWSEKGPDPQGPDPLPIELTQPDAWRIARREMELLGFPITIDPLTFLGRDDHGRQIDWPRYVPVDQLDRCLGRRVIVCGLIVADRINRATTGDLMKFVTLGDRTGFVETYLFPDAYQRFGHLTVAHPILAAGGVVEPFENRNGFTLRVTHVSPPARKG